jgi:hypothetical protein
MGSDAAAARLITACRRRALSKFAMVQE